MKNVGLALSRLLFALPLFAGACGPGRPVPSALVRARPVEGDTAPVTQSVRTDPLPPELPAPPAKEATIRTATFALG